MLEWWGPIIYEYYAGTEGAGTCLIGPDEWLTHKGSVGRSVSGPLHILDEHGTPLPAGEVGEIWFENSSDFRYLNDDDKTSESRRANGSGTFGDLGYLDADGYLYLTDRKAFTIIAGGINVYPQEIEDVLLAHPAVDRRRRFRRPDTPSTAKRSRLSSNPTRRSPSTIRWRPNSSNIAEHTSPRSSAPARSISIHESAPRTERQAHEASPARPLHHRAVSPRRCRLNNPPTPPTAVRTTTEQTRCR